MKTHLLRSILVLFISVNMFSNLNEVKGAAGWYADYIIVAVNGSGSAYYWIGADPSFGTQLQDHDFGTVSSLVITGVDMKYWGDNGDRTGGAFYYKIMSSDGNTVIVGDTEVLWDQASLGGNDFQGTKTLDINVLNSLVAATEYKLHIWAKSWGTSEGDSWLSNNGANYVASFRVENPTEWNGAKDQNWNDAANWSDGLPSLTSDVTIPTGKSPIISATDQITIFSLDVANGASLTIESGATGTGSLIVNGTVSGEVTVERHIGGNSLDWHLVSSPVDGQAISGTDNWQPNHTYDFYAWYEKEETWVNRKNTTGSPVGEGPRFDDAIVNGNLNFNPPKGYMIAYQTVGVEKSFTGTLVNENKSYTLQKESTGTYTGLNLVGNPFSSTIAGNDAASGQDEFDFLTTNSSVLADDYIAYYYWDNSKNPKDYTAINNASGADYIEVGQGFFVIAKTGETTLNINKNLRKHGDATFYKSNNLRDALVIEINDQNSKKALTELVILQNASLGLDPGYDAAKLFGNTELNVYSLINTDNDQTYAIQSIPNPQEEMKIPIGVQTNHAGLFHFTFEPTELFTQEGKVYLFDKVTQIKTEITAEAEYLFELEEAGEYNDRFEIHFGVVGIGEQDQTTTLNAYAYNNRLYVNNSLEQAQIAVYDLQGRLLMQQSANASGLQSLPLDLPAGVYVVRLSNAQEAKSVKINVQ